MEACRFFDQSRLTEAFLERSMTLIDFKFDAYVPFQGDYCGMEQGKKTILKVTTQALFTIGCR
jgi:hypothetical protein